MQTWEFRAEKLSTTKPEKIQAHLMECGNEGWELISANPLSGFMGLGSTDAILMIFKLEFFFL